MDEKDDSPFQRQPEEASMLAVITGAEIDQQIATAHRFPRSLKRFMAAARTLVTLDEATAKECMYSLPVDGKLIPGASVRFAEIILSQWGNTRVTSRVLDDSGSILVAQATFHDLEHNNAVAVEVKRRLTDKNGRRYKDHVVINTGNAAISIAFRNIVLRCIPRAIWWPIYEDARRVIAGDARTLSSRRDAAIDTFNKMGVTSEQVFAMLEVAGAEEIGLEKLVDLQGVYVAIRDNATTIDEVFPAAAGRGNAAALNERIAGQQAEAEGAGAEGAAVAPFEGGAETTAGREPLPEAKERKPRQTRAAKDPPAAEKPPTQTISNASVGDAALLGAVGTETKDPEPPPATDAAPKGDMFDVE